MRTTPWPSSGGPSPIAHTGLWLTPPRSLRSAIQRESNSCAQLASSKSRAINEPVDYAYGSLLCAIPLFARSIPERGCEASPTLIRCKQLPTSTVTELSLLCSARPASAPVRTLVSQTKGPLARQCAEREQYATRRRLSGRNQ